MYWEETEKTPGEIRELWRWGQWTLRCRVLYAEGGSRWELMPDKPIILDGHVATHLAEFEVPTCSAPILEAIHRLAFHDWEEINVYSESRSS
jgi:hypothetical protein